MPTTSRTAKENEQFDQARRSLPATVSHSKCWRIVDAFNKSRSAQVDLDTWVATYLDTLRTITAHPDPTGERAVHSALRKPSQQAHLEEQEGPEMDLLTTEEAAAFLHVPLATLRWWISESSGPRSAKIGRRRMFRRADLEKFVNDKFEAASGAA